LNACIHKQKKKKTGDHAKHAPVFCLLVVAPIWRS